MDSFSFVVQLLFFFFFFECLRLLVLFVLPFSLHPSNNTLRIPISDLISQDETFDVEIINDKVLKASALTGRYAGFKVHCKKELSE